VDSEGQWLNYAVSVDEFTRTLQIQGDRLADGSVIEAKAAEVSTIRPGTPRRQGRQACLDRQGRRL
jgi:hypothetical protein